MTKKLIMFDFDGTLVDTAPDLIRTTNLFLKTHGHAELSDEAIRIEIGYGLKNLMHQTIPTELQTPALQLRMEHEFLAIYEREMLKSPVLFPGAMEFLENWSGQIAIVSNKRYRHIVPIVELLGLKDLPWVTIIGGDSFESMKPHPMPFLEAMRKAGTERAQTVMVGDGEPDIEGAIAVGVASVAVSFGYSPIQTLVRLGATSTVDSFSDLERVITSLT
jgi:phosphoglycolate phosphatase